METYQHSIGSEISEIQREYRMFQSESKEIKELLSNQTDSSRRIEHAESNQWAGDRKVQAGIESKDRQGNTIAIGPMQIKKENAGKEMGFGVEKFSRQDLNNPRKSIKAGTQYIKGLEKEFGENAPAAYNWGPGNYRKYKKGEFTKLPEETKQYIERYKKGGSYKTYMEAEAKSTLKRMSHFHVKFMETHGVKSLKSRHNIPEEYGKQIIDQQISQVKKFDKENISIKDMNEFNRLIARQLGSLGLKD